MIPLRSITLTPLDKCLKWIIDLLKIGSGIHSGLVFTFISEKGKAAIIKHMTRDGTWHKPMKPYTYHCGEVKSLHM